jgi:hypothetical protein
MASASRDWMKSGVPPGEQGGPPIPQDMLQLQLEKLRMEKDKMSKAFQLEKKETQRIHELEMEEI